jgi:competence protein ComEC
LLRPQHVIFAAGQGNKFGFPDDEVVARYAAIGAETYTTGDSGAISVVFNSQGLLHSIKTHWQQYPRFRRRQQ